MNKSMLETSRLHIGVESSATPPLGENLHSQMRGFGFKSHLIFEGKSMTQVEAVVLGIAALVVSAIGIYAALKKAAPAQSPPQTVINNYHYTVTGYPTPPNLKDE